MSKLYEPPQKKKKILKVAVNQSLLMIQFELLIHLMHNSLL